MHNSTKENGIVEFDNLQGSYLMKSFILPVVKLRSRKTTSSSQASSSKPETWSLYLLLHCQEEMRRDKQENKAGRQARRKDKN